LALAIQTAQVEISSHNNCSNVQLTFRIQPNSTLDATETTIPLPVPSTSSPSITSSSSPPPTTTIIPENFIPSSPSPTTSYLTSSQSYDYRSSQRVRGSTSSDTSTRRKTTTTVAKAAVTVDIDEIIREVENGSRVTSPRSNDIYENTTTTQPPSSTPTTSSAPTLLYSDDILSRTAITIQPWDMIVISNDTIHEITQNKNTPFSMSLNDTLPYTTFEPITMQIIVQCGEFGKIQDNCIIHGGDTHFVIDVTLLQQPYHNYYYYNSTTAHHPSLFLPLFNIQTTIEFRGITMQSAKDTSILLYHSSGYIILANTNNSFNHTILYNTLLPTLHQVTILFQDCYWEQNYGNYGAVLNVYKEEEDVMSYPTNTHSDDTNDDDAIVVALYQLSVKFRRCIFENNFSKEGSAILIENTDWTNTLITVVESLFLNSAQSGAIRATYTSNNNTYISTTTTTTKKNESAVFKPQEIIISS